MARPASRAGLGGPWPAGHSWHPSEGRSEPCRRPRHGASYGSGPISCRELTGPGGQVKPNVGGSAQILDPAEVPVDAGDHAVVASSLRGPAPADRIVSQDLNVCE